MSRILILNGSPRKQGFTSHMVKAFSAGAEKSGNTVKKLFLDEMNIRGCRCCYAGGKSHEHPCTAIDDMDLVYTEFRRADICVLASPLFYWTVSGQLTTAIDRLFALVEEDKSQMFDSRMGGMLILAAGGGSPEQVSSYFDYLMKRLGWKNLGKIILLHTDSKDAEDPDLYLDSYEKGLSIGSSL